ncbi:MAG: hypothetical protein V4812_06845 [Pseudomonadota bacterium]
MTAKPKLIEINIDAARTIARILEKYEIASCKCDGETQHFDSCPSKEANQLRNYLTQRINNPNKKYGI